MGGYDVIVIGAGISGLSLAHYTARAGLKTLVLEKAERPGGCFYSHRTPSGFYLELGAHTCYNSYSNLIGIIDDLGLLESLQRREKVPFKLIVGGKVKAIPFALNPVELLCSAPRIFTEKKAGQTVESYYSKLVGKNNYRRVLGPVLSAVPSQNADNFPAEMLFKRRHRRKDVMKKFTLPGGLQSITDAISKEKGVELKTGASVDGVVYEGGLFRVKTEGGSYEAAFLAVATPPSAAAGMLKASSPEISSVLSLINVTKVDSVGVVVKKDSVRLKPFAGLIPLNDIFYSIVSRDTVADENYRGFSFHFRPGIESEIRLKRIKEALRVEGFEDAVERQVVLPSPSLGHERLAGELDARLSGKRLFITGNYFSGLAIEDCVARSLSEFLRLKQGL